MPAVSVLLAVVGLAVLLLTTYDALRTTVAPSAGAGPLTRRFASVVWRAARGRSSGPKGRLLSAAGSVILLGTVANWVLWTWAGWTLLFATDPGSVVESATGVTAEVPALIYFVGFTVFSLGTGDFVPHGAFWQVLTPVVTLHGLFTLTLSITYLLPVVSAAVQRRQQAAQIWGMGGSATGILTGAWHQGSFGVLERDLQLLAPALLTTVERHPTYPTLFYFHTTEERGSFPPRIAALDDAMTLLMHAVDPAVRPHPSTLSSIRRAVDDLLSASNRVVAGRDTDAPPPPDLTPLREVGIPLLDEGAVESAFARVAERRRHLSQYVVQSGWSWQATQSAPEASD